MEKKVTYTNNGRFGYVIYKDGESVLQFYYEFGGGDCVAIIDVPAAGQWETVTKRSLAEREPLLKFIAEQVVNDQTLQGSYRLSDHSIEIFSR